MKKSLLRIIALSLAVLMLLSFPFCAFADGDAPQLQVGESTIPNTNGYNETIDAVFCPQQSGIYKLYVYDNAVEIYDNGTLLGSMEFYSYETFWWYAEAGKTYDLRMTDDSEDGIPYTLERYEESLWPESGHEAWTDYYYASAQECYAWFKGAHLGIYDETAKEDVYQDGLTWLLKAGHVYRINFNDIGSGSYEFFSSPIAYQTPVTDGQENPAGCYCFTPARSGYYWATSYLSDCSADYLYQGEESHQYSFYKGSSYYFYADQPFALERQERGTVLGEGQNELFIDEAGETYWSFMPAANAVWRFSSPNEASAIAVYSGEILLGSTNGTTPLALELQAQTEYNVAYIVVEPMMRDHITIDPYYRLTEFDDVEWGGYAFAPQESGYYTFEPAPSYLVDAETQLPMENELGAYPLEAGRTYLFYSNWMFDLYKVLRTYETPKVDQTENPAAYYKFTPTESGRYHCTTDLQGLEYISGYEDGSYDYRFFEGETYLFYTDEPFVLYLDNTVKLGENHFNPTEPGSTQWSFTPAESGWYSFEIFNNGAVVSLSLGDESLGVLVDFYEPLYLKLQADTEYTLTYTVEETETYNFVNVKKLPVLTGEQGYAEGDKAYIFEAEQDGYYWFTGSYSGIWDLDEGDWVSSDTEAIYLYPEKNYRIHVWDEGMNYQYLGEEITYTSLELTDQEYPAGFYSFTPQQSGIYLTTGYFEGEGIVYEDETEEGYTYRFYKGETYTFYSRAPFTIALIPQEKALHLDYNLLMLDEPGTTEWTFTPAESGWYRFYSGTETATVAVYEGDELLGSVAEYNDLYLQLTADTTYDVIFTITNTNDSESIYIDYYQPLSGLPQEVDGGSYAYTSEEDGYYSFGKEYVSVYDPALQESAYSNIGAFKLQAEQTYLIQKDSYFNVAKIHPQAPQADGSENPAGYYIVSPDLATTYSFNITVSFSDDLDWQPNGERYDYNLAAEETHLFYSYEPFTLNVEMFTGALKAGYNSIPDLEMDLSFTPEESGWYRFVDYGESELRVLDGGVQVLNCDGYAALESGKTYAVETASNEIFIYKYSPIAAGVLATEGYYSFTPAESGAYLIDGDSIYDPQLETQPDWVLGEVLLEQGNTYLFRLYEGGCVVKSSRIYTELTLDANQKAAGYYTFTPEQSGRYSFSKPIDCPAAEWDEYNEETETFIAVLYAGETYKLYALEAFGVALLPFGTLQQGQNAVFGDKNTDISMTFTPEEDGFYAFGINGDTLEIYDGEALLGECDSNRSSLTVLQLQADTEYDLVFRYNYHDYPSVWIDHPSVLEQMDEIEYSSYIFIPEESGWYQFSDLWSSVFDVAKGEDCWMEMGAFELEAEKVYYISEMMGAIIKEPERNYTALSVNDVEKAAGYYTFVAPASGFYTFTSEIFLGNCNYENYGYDADLERYVYIFYKNQQVQFYVGEDFYVSAWEQTELCDGYNNIFADAGDTVEFTFTPQASGWHKLNAWESSDLAIYQGDQLLQDASAEQYLQLAAETAYRVVFEKMMYDDDDVERLEIAFYEDLVFEEGERYYGYCAFTPAESGYYRFEEWYNSPYDVTAEEYVESEMGEFNLVAGHTYLVDIHGTITYVGARVYTTLTIDDAVKPAGYYTYSPTKSAGYIFSEEVSGLYDYHYEGDDIVCKMYANNTYEFYVSKPFTVTKLAETTILKEGANYLYAEMGTEPSYTFTPEETAWFEIYNNETFHIYQGDTLLKSGADTTEFLKLQEGTTYTITVRRTMDPNYDSPAIYIERYHPFDQITDIPAGSWVITVDQSGYYNLSNEYLIDWGMTLYNATEDCMVQIEVGAYYLESGNEYLLWLSPDNEDSLDLIYAGEREYTDLVLNRQNNPAGYYRFTAEEQNVFLAVTEEEDRRWNWSTKVDGWEIIFCEKGETYTFYANEPFDAMDFGDFLYEGDDETVTITQYVSNSPEIVVPATINGKQVEAVVLDELLWNFDSQEEVRLTIADGIERVVAPYGRNIRVLELSSTVIIKNAEFYDSEGMVLTIPADRTDMNIFYAGEPAKIGHIFFGGTQQQWDALKATDPTGAIANAVVHTEADAEDYAVTVTEDGELVVYCNHCGSVIPGCAHENTSETSNPCNTEMIETCDDCGTVVGRTDLGNANATHSPGEVIADTPATCGKAGYGHKNCTVCGARVQSNITIAATGKHTAGDWKSTVDPTYETTGLDTKFCTVCNKALETRKVAKLIKAATVFKDVTEKNWYHDAVSYAYSNNLFKGVTETSFEPSTEMTRAMLVTVLWRYAGEPTGGTNSFKDVPNGKWYSDAVSWAASKGIVTGITTEKFDPNGIVTRAQMATILYRYAKQAGVDTAASSNFKGFADGSEVKDWAKEGMQWAVAEELITGSKQNNTLFLAPANGATRAQVATILMRYIENIVE